MFSTAWRVPQPARVPLLAYSSSLARLGYSVWCVWCCFGFKNITETQKKLLLSGLNKYNYSRSELNSHSSLATERNRTSRSWSRLRPWLMPGQWGHQGEGSYRHTTGTAPHPSALEGLVPKAWEDSEHQPGELQLHCRLVLKGNCLSTQSLLNLLYNKQIQSCCITHTKHFFRAPEY